MNSGYHKQQLGHGSAHEHNSDKPETTAAASAKYYCPMCEGVVSDKPGDCPKCGMALERNPDYREPSRTIWTCPMHPQIEQDHPGSCPICGMALEPKTVVAAPEENYELLNMTRRLWIGAALALPVFVLGMLHLVPSLVHVANSSTSRWMQFSLSTPVVLWAGWPFFVRGAKSFRSAHWNMFTLIAIGVGNSMGLQCVRFLFPRGFSPAHASAWRRGCLFRGGFGDFNWSKKLKTVARMSQWPVTESTTHPPSLLQTWVSP